MMKCLMSRNAGSLPGEKIQPEHFLELTKRDGFEIHIRTKGTFAKSVRMLDKNGTIHYVKSQKAKNLTSRDAGRQ